MHVVYIDNFINAGTSQKFVSAAAAEGSSLLKSSGLVVHEIEQAQEGGLVLGWEFGSTSFRPSCNRVLKARLAIRHVLQRGKASGRMLECLVMHLCFIGLCRRESLSVLGAVFAFIQQNYNKQALLWGSVRRELAMWDAFSPLLWPDLQQPWSSTHHSVDASNWGLGHCSAEMPIDKVKHVGRFAEKW